jgi:Asp/Glu/hydantoin racemase
MRIAIVNPNTSKSVTAMLLREARLAAAEGTDICALTARSGPPVIRTVAERIQAGGAVADAFVEAGPDIDAGIVGGFTEPGLADARERLTYPVIGLGEASMAEASSAGARFSILTADDVTVPGIQEMVERLGYAARLASVLSTDADLLAVAVDQEAFDSAFAGLAEAAAARDGADAVILGGAVFVGMAVRIGPRVPVPVIDPVHAAIRWAEMRVSSI